MKNATPRSLALFAAFIAAFIVVAAEYFINVNWVFQKNWVLIFIVFFITFASTFLIFNYLLERFIYRKIKLVYKTISRSKASNDDDLAKVDMSNDIIGNVNREVAEWQKDRSDEIAELKRMEAYRKEFIGDVSHELKTPIFNIQGFIHTLLEGGIEDQEVNIHYLQRASKSIDRLCLIVEDLEAISKLESGELALDVRTFDINELMKDVHDSTELRAKERNIQLGFKEGHEKPVFVYADKERIRQVLVNLVINSIKYGKENGKTLTGFYDLDEDVLIEITDNGIGIEPQHLPRLFERFYRVDKSRSRDQGGTGLGLAIVKHIMEAHKHSINVRSSIGIGTTFTFTLTKSR